MYVVTNRNQETGQVGLKIFGKRVNEKGPNELRVAQVEKNGSNWQVDFLDDALTQDEVNALVQKYRLAIDSDAKHYQSLKIACELAERARQEKSHILFFVHGFNNDMEDVLKRALDLEKRYGVIVVPFSWPANGGGTLSGTIAYKKDKRDARVSTGALERTLSAVQYYLQIITGARRSELMDKAEDKHPDNAEAREELYARLLEKECPFTVNALFHSMGNYLLKQTLKSSISQAAGLTFDNVLLVAADTNNLDHSLWVERIQARSRVFVTINEKDYALGASRAKSGSQQLARLGHYARNLNASNAHYINFTGASWVKNSHAYFGDPAKRNDAVFKFFKRAFSGEPAEDDLDFRPEGNWYEF